MALELDGSENLYNGIRPQSHSIDLAFFYVETQTSDSPQAYFTA